MLAQLEAEACVATCGLWVDAYPIPPWQWRKGDREPARAAVPPGRRPRCLRGQRT